MQLIQQIYTGIFTCNTSREQAHTAVYMWLIQQMDRRYHLHEPTAHQLSCLPVISHIHVGGITCTLRRINYPVSWISVTYMYLVYQLSATYIQPYTTSYQPHAYSTRTCLYIQRNTFTYIIYLHTCIYIAEYIYDVHGRQLEYMRVLLWLIDR